MGTARRSATASMAWNAAFGLARNDGRHTTPENPGLLAGHPEQVGAQKHGMIEIDRGDYRQAGTFEYIGRVQPPPQPDFDDRQISRLLRHGQEGRRRRHLEDRGGDAVINRFQTIENRLQFRIFD